MAEVAHQISPPASASSQDRLPLAVPSPTAIVGASATLLLVDLLLPWYTIGADAYRQSSTGVSSAGVRFLVLLGVSLVMAHFAFSSRLASRASTYYAMALSFAIAVGVVWSFTAKSPRGFGEMIKPTAGSFVPVSEVSFGYGIFAAVALAATMLVASVLRLRFAESAGTGEKQAFPIAARVAFALAFVAGILMLLASAAFVFFAV